MTPARSPNMNSGWPEAIRSSSDLPSQRLGARRGGDDLEVAVGDRQREAAAHAVVDGALEDVAACRGDAGALFGQQHHGVDQLAGRQRQHRLGVALDIVVPVEQGEEADRRHDHQEDDDQRRDRTLEQRLGGEQAAIGWLGDEARMSARTALLAGPAPDKNRPVGRVPRVRIRHISAPLSPLPS